MTFLRQTYPAGLSIEYGEALDILWNDSSRMSQYLQWKLEQQNLVSSLTLSPGYLSHLCLLKAQTYYSGWSKISYLQKIVDAMLSEWNLVFDDSET